LPTGPCRCHHEPFPQQTSRATHRVGVNQICVSECVQIKTMWGAAPAYAAVRSCPSLGCVAVPRPGCARMASANWTLRACFHISAGKLKRRQLCCKPASSVRWVPYDASRTVSSMPCSAHEYAAARVMGDVAPTCSTLPGPIPSESNRFMRRARITFCLHAGDTEAGQEARQAGSARDGSAGRRSGPSKRPKPTPTTRAVIGIQRAGHRAAAIAHELEARGTHPAGRERWAPAQGSRLLAPGRNE